VAYDDDASFDAVMTALTSPDTWLSVSAAEALGRFQPRAAVVAPALIAASAAGKPTSLRISALTPLVTLSPDAARALATQLSTDPSVTAQQAAAQALRQLDAAAARAAQAGAGAAAPTGRAGGGNAPGAGRGAAPPRPAIVARPDSEYHDLVTTWIVPDYNGAPRPHVVLGTRRGQIDIELFPGDAPFGVECLLKVVESGEIVNTEFGRVVPNFVAQQRAIRNTGTLRDEVNRHGLLRGTLSWASSGLDTGRPGYTLGSTPQPHNEGDFTALGRVVTGLDVVDHIELGDRITAARRK
jgi:cyclophilin family peptidyl-prolyl cis-trans isomerase